MLICAKHHVVLNAKQECGLCRETTVAQYLDDDTPYDPVNHPQHYTSHPSGIECITITRHMNFNRGNAMKYIWRAGEKGDLVEDLEKAMWYLQDEINMLTAMKKGS